MRKGVIEITIVCELDKVYFAPWEDLLSEQQAIFDKKRTNCDGLGYISQGCIGCDFCYDTELEDAYMETINERIQTRNVRKCSFR